MKEKHNISFEIQIDNTKLSTMYPNYRMNFHNTEDFVKMLTSTMIEAANGIDGNSWEKYGFQVTAKKVVNCRY